MEFAEKFNEVLNGNEKVLKVYKPNKLKYWLAKTLLFLLYAAVFAMVVVSFSFISEKGDQQAENVVFNPEGFAISLSVCSVFLICLAIYFVFFYRNLYYCVTSERVLIRRGVFGTDFKTLDMQMIGATNVHVSLLDKIVKRNTGSIVFGSNSAPIMGQGSTFVFKDIVDPYNESKEIKSAVDEFKAHQKKSES